MHLELSDLQNGIHVGPATSEEQIHMLQVSEDVVHLCTKFVCVTQGKSSVVLNAANVY